MIGQLTDRFVGLFSPHRALRRRLARESLAMLGEYEAAKTDRLHADWIPSSEDNNDTILRGLDLMRRRSRDLVQNSGYAASLLQTNVDYIIGTGIRPQSIIDYERIGITRERAEKFQRDAEKAFERFVETSDAGGRQNFYEQQAMALRSMDRDGEALALLPRVEHKRRPYRVAVQLLEPERLKAPSMGDRSIPGGVQIGDYGEPVRYYISPTSSERLISSSPKPVDATDSEGRPLVLHLYHQLRPSQVRGIPLLHPVFNRLKHVDSYLEAEMVAARAAACIGVFIKTMNPNAGVTANAMLQTDGSYLETLRPGMLERLNTNEEPVAFNPNRPGTTFDGFIRRNLVEVSAVGGFFYELMAKDFGEMNYSSMRGAMLDARRTFTRRQAFFAHRFCQPVYDQVLEEAFLAGDLGYDIPFYEFVNEFCAAIWIAQGYEWIDPEKEVKAAVLALQNNLTTLFEQHGVKGQDWEKVLQQRGKEKAREKLEGVEPLKAGTIQGNGIGSETDRDERDEGDPGEADEEQKGRQQT